MKHKTKTITFKYREFERGEIVTAVRDTGSLTPGERYEIEKFYEPHTPLDNSGVVILKGVRYGVSADLLVPVEET